MTQSNQSFSQAPIKINSCGKIRVKNHATQKEQKSFYKKVNMKQHSFLSKKNQKSEHNYFVK